LEVFIIARRKITPNEENNAKNYWSCFKGLELTMLPESRNYSKKMVSTVLENGLEGELEDD